MTIDVSIVAGFLINPASEVVQVRLSLPILGIYKLRKMVTGNQKGMML